MLRQGRSCRFQVCEYGSLLRNQLSECRADAPIKELGSGIKCYGDKRIPKLTVKQNLL
jgi:hypothetical protein